MKHTHSPSFNRHKKDEQQQLPKNIKEKLVGITLDVAYSDIVIGSLIDLVNAVENEHADISVLDEAVHNVRAYCSNTALSSLERRERILTMLQHMVYEVQHAPERASAPKESEEDVGMLLRDMQSATRKQAYANSHRVNRSGHAPAKPISRLSQRR